MQKAISILLIEDNDIDAELIQRSLSLVCSICNLREESKCDSCLAAKGYDLHRETTLNKGMVILNDREFDIVLLDLSFPGISGLNGLQDIRSQYPTVPIVALMGDWENVDAFEALRHGAQDFLIKGEFTARELQRCIEYSMERFQLKLELENTATELAKQSSILKSVFNSIGDGVVVIDGSGRPRLLNPAAQELLDASWMETAVEQWPGVQELLEKPQATEEKDITDTLFEALKEQPDSQEEVYIQSDKHPDGKYISITKRTIDEGDAIDGCVAVLHDVTKRREIEKMKDEFVSVVSHELRTPLTSINGSIKLALGGITGNMSEGVRNMLVIAERNSNHLLGLINDLLDIQKYNSGNLELALEPLELKSLIADSIIDNKVYAAEYGVSIEYRMGSEEADCIVLGDTQRLGQVMTNLISNAVKYSPKGESIWLELGSDPLGKAMISVRDNGPGIPENARSSLFEKFTQVDSSNTRKKGGTGLGLSICKSIIEAHGGEIDYECPGEGGTRFYFTLPEYNA